MAEISKLTGIELNGVFYSLGKSIYEELGVSLERFAELLGRDLYCPTLSSAPTSSTLKYTDTDGDEHTFQVGQPCRWSEGGNYRIAVCRDITGVYSDWYVLPVKVSELNNDAGYATAASVSSGLATKQDAISDLATIRSGASKGATALQEHQDISGKLDIATAAATYLNKTDASNTYLGKSAKAVSAGSADNATKATQDASGNVITSTYATKTELATKQNKVLKFENKTASSWVSDTTQPGFSYRSDIACAGVTEEMYPEVVLYTEQATSGEYAPVSETKDGYVSIWSKKNVSVEIPTIIVTE